MRLEPAVVAAIVEVVAAYDPHARAYLFGSRVDDTRRGGDIDLLVLSEAASLATRLDLLIALKQRLGEQRIDLLLRSPNAAASDPFVRAILPTAICLA